MDVAGHWGEEEKKAGGGGGGGGGGGAEAGHQDTGGLCQGQRYSVAEKVQYSLGSKFSAGLL